MRYQRKVGAGALTLLLILLLGLSLLGPVRPVLAGGTTTISASGVQSAIGNIGGDTYGLAQSFEVYAGNLSQFSFKLLPSAGSPVGTLTWAICNDNSGVPGTVLATGEITPTENTTNTVSLDEGSRPLLAASTAYWLALHSTASQSVGIYWVWQGGSDSYFQGIAMSSVNGTWTNRDWIDLESSYTTVDPPTDTPTTTFTPSNTPTVTPSLTNTPITLTPTDTNTPTITYTPSITFTPSVTTQPTWTLTPTPNLYVITTLTTGQQVAVKYEFTAGDAMTGALLIMLLTLVAFGLFMQMLRRRQV